MRKQTTPLIAGLMAIVVSVVGCSSSGSHGLRQDEQIRRRSSAGGKAFLVQQSRQGVTFTSYLVGDPSTVQEFSVARVEADMQMGKLTSEAAWSLLADAWSYYRSIQVADTGDGASNKAYSDQQQSVARVQRIKIHQLMKAVDADMTKAFTDEYNSGDKDLSAGLAQQQRDRVVHFVLPPAPPANDEKAEKKG